MSRVLHGLRLSAAFVLEYLKILSCSLVMIV